MKAFKHICSIVTLLLLSTTFSFAQLYKIELDEKVQKSSLIVEGKVIARQSFWNEDQTMIYTSNTIEIYKSFKGEVKDKKIEIITVGGTVGLRYIEASDLLGLDVNDKGVFFLNAKQNRKSPFSNKIMYDVYSSAQGFFSYDEINDVAYAPFANYKGIETTFYSTLKSKTGLLKVIDNSFKVQSTNASNSETGTLAATISSFSPTTVTAGTFSDAANNVLTINGSGFGSPGGLCAVRFKNGNSSSDIPSYSLPYTSKNIISWSDTKIVLQVPGGVSRQSNSGVAATGKISVVTSSGSVTTSSDILNVFYSLITPEFNFGGSVIAGEPRMMNTNGQGGYTYRYCTSTAGGGKNFSTAPEKVTFERALATWKEQIGLNFIQGSTTTVQLVADDNINIIMFDNRNKGADANILPDGTLATTYSFFSACSKNSTELYPAQRTGFDIVIRNNGVSSGSTTFEEGPCFPQGNDLDLEMVIFHELGHALNLAHINDGDERNQGNNALYVNPNKLMHYAISNYVNRRSLDASAYQGGLYATKKRNDTYGVCDLFTTEMTPLSYTVIPNDNCPSAFPTSVTPLNTVVNFDLVHATSNKLSDPQSNVTNCGGTTVSYGQFVVNNAYYALKTGTSSNGTLNVLVSNYATTPADQANCAGQGVKMLVFDVTTCPAGQSFPEPVACRSFSANGSVTAITGLAANHNYLLYFDGLRNTKAKFSVTLNGSALPLSVAKFTGEYINNTNKLYIDIVQAINVKSVKIEKSANGTDFKEIGALAVSGTDLLGKHTYTDAVPFAGNNFYRLAIVNNDGSVDYSNIINIGNESVRLIHIYPNPVKDILVVNITANTASKYQYSVYDVTGKIVRNSFFDAAQGEQTIKIPMSNVAAGNYYIKVTDAEGKVVAKQSIIKQ